MTALELFDRACACYVRAMNDDEYREWERRVRLPMPDAASHERQHIPEGTTHDYHR